MIPPGGASLKPLLLRGDFVDIICVTLGICGAKAGVAF
jgi:hypothetical protein